MNSLKNNPQNGSQHDSGLNMLNIQPLIFDLSYENEHIGHASIIIPAAIINTLYLEASLSQKTYTQAFGFNKGEVPLEYIASNFKVNLIEHIKEFLFKFFVVDFLLEQIHTKKLLVAGEPRLIEVTVELNQPARFKFELSLFDSIGIQEWKYLPFKSPKRKNYKELDLQVDMFVKEEQGFLKNADLTTLAVGDWVNFKVNLLNNTNTPLFNAHTTSLWLKLGDEEIDNTFHDIFLNKTIGSCFTTTSKSLQDYFSNLIDTNYTFSIEITDILKNNFFCLDSFKRHFRLKTNKEMHQKLIEVFSYRNDLSLRRSMAEESLKLLLSKHRFVIPNYLILRQQEVVLDSIKQNSDYHVYRMQKDFKERIRQLAEKQLRETLFLNQLAYHEELEVSDSDLKGYLNLTNRPRMKDFLYFDAPETKVHGQEIPLSTQELKQFNLREKTLNHIIYHLMKK
ncbi:MAG: hypothetical protein NTX86_04510 [Candidatus Dependentiae bacterium]|nr:hypothetical protein [Candidatus Dependentiae bacterium]